jgi:DNA-binding CsgD family transcriptional regulator
VFGKSYFDLARAVYRSTNFEDLVDLLVAKLPPLIGAEEVLVMQISPTDGVCEVSTHGPLARRLAANLARVNDENDRHPIHKKVDFSDPGDLGFAMSDHMSSEDYKSSPFTQAVFGSMAADDVLFGMIVQGEYRKAYLNCYLRGGHFTAEARERFDAILLTARGVLDRMEFFNIDKMVRQRIFMSRAEAPLAVLILKANGEITPLNHAAVQMAEAWWGPDEAVRQLGEAKMNEIFGLLSTAWANPVTAVWKDLNLDLGGGLKKIHALPQLRGEIILMLAVDEAPPGEDVVVGILTRRQREIMDWIAEGKTSAEAAIILGISPRTVEKHLEAVFQRMGVENRIAAVRRYLDLKRGL